jgi:hypothetical protein
MEASRYPSFLFQGIVTSVQICKGHLRTGISIDVRVGSSLVVHQSLIDLNQAFVFFLPSSWQKGKMMRGYSSSSFCFIRPIQMDSRPDRTRATIASVGGCRLDDLIDYHLQIRNNENETAGETVAKGPGAQKQSRGKRRTKNKKKSKSFLRWPTIDDPSFCSK